MKTLIILKWLLGVNLLSVLLFVIGDSVLAAIVNGAVVIFLFFLGRKLGKLDKNLAKLGEGIDGKMTQLLNATNAATKAETIIEEGIKAAAKEVPGTVETDDRGSVPGMVTPNKKI